MNSNTPEETQRSHITPSGRPSIHSYRNNNMVRYGIKTTDNRNHQRNSPTVNDNGVDVVDNIMSKMAREKTPLPIRRKMINRTNSCSNDEESSGNFTDVLSKSLPSTLPSHLYYSDDNENEDQRCFEASPSTISDDSNQSSQFNRSHLAFDPPNTPDSNHSSQFSRSNIILEGYRSNVSSSVPPVQKQSKSNYFQSVIVILSLLMVVVAVYYSNLLGNVVLGSINLDKSTQPVGTDDIIFENLMDNLQDKYNIDHDSILKLKSGISSIFSRMDTGSFIFTYNSKTLNFNPLHFDRFITEVANTAAKYLRNNISPVKPTVILSTSLDMREHGELIDRYRDDVDRNGVLLVKNIEKVPSNLAMAFHYYCDEYNPLVKRSAIFFTLDLDNCSNNSDKESTHDFIETCLTAIWKTVPSENMKPLLTRLVDVIIDVSNSFTLQS